MYITLFYDDFLIGTELSDVMSILSPSIDATSLTSDITSISGIVTSVEPTSGTSGKYIVNKYIIEFCQLATKQPLLVLITTSSAFGIMLIIIVVITIIVIVIVCLKKKRYKGEGKNNLVSIGNEQDNEKGNLL